MFAPRRYTIELGSAFVLYALLLLAANWLERAIEPTGGLRLAIALAPMLGAVAAAWAVLRGLWRMDEMQRRIQYDAIALSFLGTALITFGWGFAESAGLPRLPTFAIWPIMGTLWGLGLIVAQRRYR